MLTQDKNEGSAHLDMLNRELADYQVANAKPEDMVSYGSRQLPRSEAERLTNQAIARTSKKLDELNKHLAAPPTDTSIAQRLGTEVQ